MEVESKEYSWKCVSADELLSHGPCEFIYAKLTPDTLAGSATLYDGENTLGKKIVTLNISGLWNCECAPPVPVYCRRGLYFKELATCSVLVIWRELRHKGGGG